MPRIVVGRHQPTRALQGTALQRSSGGGGGGPGWGWRADGRAAVQGTTAQPRGHVQWWCRMMRVGGGAAATHQQAAGLWWTACRGALVAESPMQHLQLLFDVLHRPLPRGSYAPPLPFLASPPCYSRPLIPYLPCRLHHLELQVPLGVCDQVKRPQGEQAAGRGGGGCMCALRCVHARGCACCVCVHMRAGGLGVHLRALCVHTCVLEC